MNKSKRYGHYVRFEDMTWPLPIDSLEWVLRNGTPTKEQLLHAASIVSAYEAAIFRTQKRRNFILGELKIHLIDLKKEEEEKEKEEYGNVQRSL